MTQSTTQNQIERLMLKVSASKKYSGIDKSLIEKLAISVSERYPEKLRENKLKDLLHQVWGAFRGNTDLKKLYKEAISAEGVDESNSQNTSVETSVVHASQQEILIKLLNSHSSTAERLAQHQEFYDWIFKETGPVDLIQDFGCGLNPILYLYYIVNKVHQLRYEYYDIDSMTLDTINLFFGLKYFDSMDKKVTLKTKLWNAFQNTDKCSFVSEKNIYKNSVSFMFKLLPVLEVQEKGLSKKLINNINSDWLVVSFPLRTLGGKNVNMVNTYSNWFELELLSEIGYSLVAKKNFVNELAYILKKSIDN